MNTCFSHLASAFCLSSTLISCVAFAEPLAAQGGSVTFSGIIIEYPCDLSTQSLNISVSCDRDGKAYTSNYSLRQVYAGKDVDHNRANIRLHYMNPEKTLGIVTTSYR